MEYQLSFKNKKGVAGLELILSVVSMLFLIGIIVMVFALAGGKLTEAVRETDSATFNESKTMAGNGTYVTLVIDGQKTDCGITSLRAVNTSSFSVIESGNYTYTNCKVITLGNNSGSGTGSNNFSNTNWTLSGGYQWTSNANVRNVINNTTGALDDVIDWFPTFIVLAAMVVLILLVVIIIRSIKGSGITEGA